MELGEGEVLKDIDPAELGGRIRAARVSRGWTQTELAGDLVSVGYVSRLESGQRRPNAMVLEGLAARLEVPVDQLLRGATAREYDAIRLELDYAELSLESGEPVEAESRARIAIDRASSGSLNELADRGHFLVARALEAQGSMDDAILLLEPLVSNRSGTLRIDSAIALSRCYRESGDLGLAVDIGEKLLTELAGTPLASTDEAVQLAVTVAAAYYERGDLGQAVRTCRRAIDKAEQLASPRARASAYWNASMMEQQRGAVAEAIPLAERALRLLGEGKDGRNLGRLRLAFADMQLELDPPDIAAAEDQLARAGEELRTSSAGAIDLARHELVRARAHLFSGAIDQARELSLGVYSAVRETSPTTAADAKSIEGQALAAIDRVQEAGEAYRTAVMLLTGVGADREAAQLWFDLAGLLEEIGDLEFARNAYRSAAASVGIHSRPTARSRQSSASFLL